MFVQRMLKRGLEWVQVGVDYDYQMEIARSAYADMLHDQERNKKYQSALKKVINHTHSRGEKAVVLDIGTGTGLLAMMASRLGADEVYACETFPPMYSIAQRVTTTNNLPNIKLIPKRSTDLIVGVDIPLCNILVAELFDTELLGEHAISSYNHANANLLTPNHHCIPHSANVYVISTKSDVIKKFNTIELIPPTLDCPGLNTVQDLQLSMLDVGEYSPPEKVFEFDFTKQIELTRTTSFTSGNYDTVFLYWDMMMVDPKIDCSLVLSNQPVWVGESQWREHWIQCAYYLPPANRLNRITHTEFDFNFGTTNCSCGYHRHVSRTRMYQLNTMDYAVYKDIASEYKSVVVLSDHTLLPLVLSSETKVVGQIGLDMENKLVEAVVDGETLVIGDPYFLSSSLGHLQFYNRAKELKSSRVEPKLARVHALCVKFDHLWKIRAAVGETCGFDLTDFDDVIMSSTTHDTPLEPHPLWQYTYKVLHQQTLFQIDTTTAKQSAEIKPPNDTNGIVIYIDYLFDDTLITPYSNENFTKSSLPLVYFYNKDCTVTFDFDQGLTAAPGVVS